MLRSLQARLLIASMTIAVCAVAAAWLTSRDTTKQLEGDLQRTLEADGYIYDELHTFSTERSSWDGVEELVDDLADQHRGQGIRVPRPPTARLTALD